MRLGGILRRGKDDADGKSEKQLTSKATDVTPVPESATPGISINDEALYPPSIRFSTPRYSGASTPFGKPSSFVEEIKYEVICNWLYQQQCSKLWVSDGTGELEGCLVRKSRRDYMACPPQLAYSTLADACAGLNVQVTSPVSL